VLKSISKTKNYQLSLPPSPHTVSSIDKNYQLYLSPSPHTVSSISRFATALESRRSSTASERKGARGLRASLTRGKSLNRSRSKSPFRSFRFRKSKPDADTTYSDDEGGETFRLIGRFREMPAAVPGTTLSFRSSQPCPCCLSRSECRFFFLSHVENLVFSKARDGIFGHYFGLESFATSYSQSLPRRILTILYSGFNNPILTNKIRETRKLNSIHEQHFVERINEGRKPHKNLNLRRLEFMSRNLD
jgi:hypothetical protein